MLYPWCEETVFFCLSLRKQPFNTTDCQFVFVVFQEQSFYESIPFYNIATNSKHRILRTKNVFLFLCKTTNPTSRPVLVHPAFTIVRARKKLDRQLEFFSLRCAFKQEENHKNFSQKNKERITFFEWTVLLMQILKSCGNFFDAFTISSRLHGMLSMVQTHRYNVGKCCIMQHDNNFFRQRMLP